MNLKQLEYMIAIADERNITKAADRLFLTQSALNQQLLKLEKELRTPLFFRTRNECIPTQAGEIYLKTAREMLRMKEDTYRQISDIADLKTGTLSVGFTPNRGSRMFSALYPGFHRSFPQVHLVPLELSVRAQQEQIAYGALDLGFVTVFPEQKKSGLTYTTLTGEEIFLALPEKLADHLLDKSEGEIEPKSDLPAATASADAPYPSLDLGRLKKYPFVLMYQQSTIRRLIDRLFEEAGFTPDVLFETSSTNTIITMIQAGACCGFVPACYADLSMENIRFFSLPSRPKWEVCACFLSGRYLSKAAREFISQAAMYWR